MTLKDDRIGMNDQDAGDESAWTVAGHSGLNLNDGTSQIPIFREGLACGDGQIAVATGTFTEDTPTNISNGIRADKLYVIWLWMTANSGYDGTTHIQVGIADGTGWTGNGGLWDMKALFQETDRGGWQPCVVYPTSPDATIGTFGSMVKSSIDSQRVDISNASGVQIRLFGIEASFVISYIGGHSATITLENLATHSKDKTNDRDFGIFNQKGLAFRSQVVIRLGDAAATALTTWNEQSKIIHFDTFNSDHEIGWDFINDTGGDELHFQMGDFIGGAPVAGTFCFWNVHSPLNSSAVFVDPANCDKFRLYAGTFLNSGPIELPPHVTSKGSVADLVTIAAGGSGYSVGDDLTATSGTGTKATFNVDAVVSGAVTAVTQLTEGSYTVDPTNPSATTVAPTGGTGATLNITTRFFKECKGYTFDTCGEVDIGDLTFEDNKILNAVSGVLYAGTGSRLSKNNSYIGCADAIHFDTAQTVSIDGDIFAGNTTDIHFSGTGTLTINAINGANPTSSRVSGGGTVVINNNKTLTITGLQSGSEVRLHRVSDGVEIDGVESSGTSFVHTYTFTSNTAITIMIMKLTHKIRKLTHTLISTNTVRVAGQEPDPDYENPP